MSVDPVMRDLDRYLAEEDAKMARIEAAEAALDGYLEQCFYESTWVEDKLQDYVQADILEVVSVLAQFKEEDKSNQSCIKEVFRLLGILHETLMNDEVLRDEALAEYLEHF